MKGRVYRFTRGSGKGKHSFTLDLTSPPSPNLSGKSPSYMGCGIHNENLVDSSAPSSKFIFAGGGSFGEEDYTKMLLSQYTFFPFWLLKIDLSRYER